MGEAYVLGVIKTNVIADIVVLTVNDVIGGAGFIPLENPPGVDYVVTAGMTLKVGLYAIYSTVTGLSFGYADDAIGTNYVPLIPVAMVVTAASTLEEYMVFVEIPAGKYPQFESTIAATVRAMMHCVEN